MKGDLFSSEFLARLERLSIRARSTASGISFGRGRGKSAAVGGGLEFVDVREYVPGDDLRAVDWNLYARLEKLLLRLYRQEQEHDVHVLLDISDSMRDPDPEKLGRAYRIAAALAYVGLTRLDRVAVWPISDGDASGAPLRPPFPLAAGKRRVASLFRYLERLEPGGRTDLAAAADVFVRMAPSRGVAIVISDFYDFTGSRDGIRALLSAGFEVHGVQVLGALDHAPDAAGRLELVDSETGNVVRGRVAPDVRERLSERLAEHRAQLSRLIVSTGGGFAVAGPERSLEDLLLRDLRRRGVVE